MELINHFKGTQILTPPSSAMAIDEPSYPDLRDIKGQYSAKRAIEVAAAGGHNLLMTGPPGAGKSMIATRLPGILPPLDASEALEISMIQSIAGVLTEAHLPAPAVPRSALFQQHAVLGRWWRTSAPRRSFPCASRALFLDELAEFSRTVLDSLRQSIESGRAVVSWANNRFTYPARFQLVAAMNPCRYGHIGDPARACARAA